MARLPVVATTFATTPATTLDAPEMASATTPATTLQTLETAVATTPTTTGTGTTPPPIPPALFTAAPPTAEWLKQWRIEINRRRHKESGGFTYHWNYRITLSDGQRTAMYGGTLAVLIGLNKERWNEYQDRSAEHARRRRQK